MAAYVAIVIGVVRVAVRCLQFLYDPTYVLKSYLNTCCSSCVVMLSDESNSYVNTFANSDLQFVNDEFRLTLSGGFA